MNSVADIVDTFGVDPQDVDKLLPELRPYLVVLGSGTALRSPFVVQVPFYSWKMANSQHAQKKSVAEIRIRYGAFDEAIWFYERAFRLQQLITWADAGMLRLPMLRKLLPAVWTDAEELWPYRPHLLRLFQQCGYLTDTTEELPDHFMAYRGACAHDAVGMSWTRDYDRAVFFARRFGKRNPVILQADVHRGQVLAYFTGRQEDEVVLDTRRLRYATSGWRLERAR